MNTPRNFYFSMVILMVLLLIIQFMDLNHSLFLKLNHAAQFMPISWWGYLTYMGDGMAAGCILAVVFRKAPRIALVGIIAVLLSGLIVQVLKSYLSIPRPAGILSLDEFYLYGDILKSRAFPSGHSSTAFSLLGTFFYVSEDNKRIILFFATALLIAFSRVAIGIHWPTDILAGSMIGLGAIYLISKNLNIETKWADFSLQIPLPTSSFDVIVAGETLEHLPYPAITLSEISRILIPDGLFIGSVPNSYHLKNRLRVLKGRLIEYDQTHLRAYSVMLLRQYLEKNFVLEELISCRGRSAFLSIAWFGRDLVWKCLNKKLPGCWRNWAAGRVFIEGITGSDKTIIFKNQI